VNASSRPLKIITGKENINSNKFFTLYTRIHNTREVTVTSWKLTEVVWSSEEILSVRESYAIGTSYPIAWSTPVQSTRSRIVRIASGTTTVHAELLARLLQVQVSGTRQWSKRVDLVMIMEWRRRFLFVFILLTYFRELFCFRSWFQCLVWCGNKYKLFEASYELFVINMSEEDWGQLADEQEKKLASTVCASKKNHVTIMIKEWITHVKMWRWLWVKCGSGVAGVATGKLPFSILMDRFCGGICMVWHKILPGLGTRDDTKC